MFVVNEPVVNLRSQPDLFLREDYSHQAGRESQLLLGERVQLIETQGEWVKIAALEQLRFRLKEGWHPYPGWVKRTELKELAPPFSQPISNVTLCRQTLVEKALLFLDTPYLWGGRSFHCKERISGVDCSGLINLLYRLQGIYIPRDAHDQFLASNPTSQLLPGDPLYLTKGDRITHVILKLSDSLYIEAPETGKMIRLLTWGQHVWQEQDKIFFFDRPDAYKSFPRAFN